MYPSASEVGIGYWEKLCPFPEFFFENFVLRLTFLQYTTVLIRNNDKKTPGSLIMTVAKERQAKLQVGLPYNSRRQDVLM